MIRSNLSTRPFYNERIVRLWLMAFLGVVIVFSAFNATRILRYSQSDTQLNTQAARDESRAAELRTAAIRLRMTVDPKQIEYASLEARQANDLIDRRTFSWTELFNYFESTLPDDVRITSFRSKIDKGQIVLTITIVARGAEDVSKFMDDMKSTGAFTQVGATLEERMNEQGQLTATLQIIYLPMVGHTAGRRTGGARR
jgi:Tfp pilus assembly protein PilN